MYYTSVNISVYICKLEAGGRSRSRDRKARERSVAESPSALRPRPRQRPQASLKGNFFLMFEWAELHPRFLRSAIHLITATSGLIENFLQILIAAISELRLKISLEPVLFYHSVYRIR